MSPIWDATTTGQQQRTGQVHTMTDGGNAGGQGCGCAGCCSSSTSSTGNRAADVETDASVTGGTSDTIQSLAAPGSLSTEDALLIWTAINTLILAYWAYTEVRG
ncbi:hypothetical protein ACOZ4L_05705 [Haloplanus ruber]|uniref:Uncharacterized protein n=1 Tax=Haloplanus ruber TaxID=869892 RepID=A0ABD6CYP2_9EURY|nr:hypothetical protein [Haloplanus ruber]